MAANSPSTWRQVVNGELRVGAYARNYTKAAWLLLSAAIATAGCLWIGSSNFSPLAMLLGAIAAVLVGLSFWNVLAWYELVRTRDHLRLRRGVGPLHLTRTLAIGDIRKVECVDQVDDRSKKPLGSVFMVFSDRVTWTFGRSLTAPSIDFLWAELSTVARSSRRTEYIDTSASSDGD